MKIYIGDSLNTFLDGGLRETLARMGAEAWQSSLPAVVVTPNPAINNAIRQNLSEHDIGLLGLEFLRAEDLRSMISSRLEALIPEADTTNLGAIMREVAVELSAEFPENRTFAAMSLSPDFLLDTVLLLASGGWTPASIPSPDLRRVGEAFLARVNELGMAVAPAFDLSTQSQAVSAEPWFHEIALVGFDASHWELWGLLSSASMSAKRASVWLPDWSIKGEEAEMVWFCSWESLRNSEAMRLDPAENSPILEGLADLYEADFEDATCESLEAPVEMRVEADYSHVAKSAVGDALRALQMGKRKICVAVPTNCFAGRNVSKILCDLEVEHFFSEGNRSSGVGESGAWDSLLRYLETDEVTFLKAFFQSLPTVPKAMRKNGVTTSRLVRVLDKYRDAVLTDHTESILNKLDAVEKKSEVALAKFIRSITRLPQTGSIQTFAKQLEEICKFLGWDERASIVLDRTNECPFPEAVFHREVFLTWISEVTLKRDRSENAGKAYAPIQIVPLDGANLIKWDHVILIGVNEGVFPTTPEYPAYISVSDLKALNERVKDLNERAVIGQEDEVHVRLGHALCLPPQQERLIQGRNFSRLLRNTDSITMIAAAYDETDGGKEMFPSEIFTVCFGLKYGRNLNQEGFHGLTGNGTYFSYPRVSSYDHNRIQECEAAKQLRSKDVLEFSEYEFSLMKPDHGICVPASAWSLIASRPDIVFFRYFLGVELSEENDEFQWNRAVGVWAHRIIAEAIGVGAVPLPIGDEWLERVIKSGTKLREDFRLLVEHSESPAPGWLDHLISQAQSIASGMAVAFGEARLHAMGYTHVFSEWSVDTQYKFNGHDVHCLGNIDLLLTDNPEKLKGAKVAVFDAKTGADEKLNLKSINKGKGLQLVSYGLGLKALGAAEIQLGIVTQDGKVDPQVSIADLEESLSDMEGLGGFLQRLVFGDLGHKGTEYDAYSFNNRTPITTVPTREKYDATYRSHSI